MTLKVDMQMDEASVIETVESTEGFSFAYLKELFLSSIMQWMNTMKRGATNTIVIAQAAALREQMQSMSETANEELAVDDFQLTA